MSPWMTTTPWLPSNAKRSLFTIVSTATVTRSSKPAVSVRTASVWSSCVSSLMPSSHPRCIQYFIFLSTSTVSSRCTASVIRCRGPARCATERNKCVTSTSPLVVNTATCPLPVCFSSMGSCLSEQQGSIIAIIFSVLN